MERLTIPLPDTHLFDQYNNNINEEEFRRVCQEFAVSPRANVWRNQYYFSTYQRVRRDYPTPGLSDLDNDSWSRWIIDKSDGLTRAGITKLSESARIYTYSILTSQASTRSSIVGNDSRALDTQTAFMSNFEITINRKVDVSRDSVMFQNTLELAMSKLDYVIGSGVYMLPSNLNLRIGSKVGYNNKILVSPVGAMIGVNGVLNKVVTKTVTKPSTVVTKPNTTVVVIKPSTTVTTSKPSTTVGAYTSTEEEEIVVVGLVAAIGGGLYWYYSRR